jgi:hypothetical protein
VSGAVVRAGGLNYVTEAAKQAFGTLMLDGFGHISKTAQTLADLHPGDKLLTKGLTEEQFQIWRQAPLEDFLGSKLLTYDGIMSVQGVDEALKKEAALKLMSIVLEESDIAIVTPGTKERATLFGNVNRGTLLGEIGYSLAKFKSFPLAMITKHYKRASHMQGASRYTYVATLLSTGIVGGALATQLNELLNGRDPLDMTDPSFIIKSLLKSGALSFYGDFLSASETQYGQGYLGALGGPVVGAFEEFLKLTLGNAVTAAQQAAAGEPIKTDVGAEAVRFIKGMTPGTSIWWLKGILDHGIFQNLQEEVSPGYLRRMEKRAKKNYKQQYFAKPGKFTSRPPNFNRAIGQ